MNIKAIVEAIGEVVTQHTPMLEMISGQREQPEPDSLYTGG